MSRATYDNLFNPYTGPGAPIPGQPKLAVLGRFVPIDNIVQRSEPGQHLVGYLTTDSPSLSTGTFSPTGTGFSVDLDTADVLFGPGLPFLGATVYAMETVFPYAGGQYNRYWLYAR